MIDLSRAREEGKALTLKAVIRLWDATPAPTPPQKKCMPDTYIYGYFYDKPLYLKPLFITVTTFLNRLWTQRIKIDDQSQGGVEIR